MITPLAWLAGALYAVTLWAILHRCRRGPFGPADRVTLARAVLTGVVAALVVDGSAVAALTAVAAVALALDWVDGQVARRTGTVSSFGARFDMETDAFLVLVLSVHVAASLGAWVLAIGAMRYAFVAASWSLPWLRGPLPPSFARKTVAAVQGIVLVAAGSGALPGPAAVATVIAALAALLWSFGRDVLGLWRGAHAPALAEPAGGKVAERVAAP
ncbi:CDP-alcohol phosphatidyltransferase family protein [Spirillospora sp. CA-255316]